jgi:hypothetical protein
MLEAELDAIGAAVDRQRRMRRTAPCTPDRSDSIQFFGVREDVLAWPQKRHRFFIPFVSASMPTRWICPACGQFIGHNQEDVPSTGVVYRCHICRLELVFDQVKQRLVLVSFDRTGPDGSL